MAGAGLRDEQAPGERPGGPHRAPRRVHDGGRAVRYEPARPPRHVRADDPQPSSAARATSTRRAWAATSAGTCGGGSALWVGTNSALAPRAAVRRAGSAKLESLQMTMPNVSPSTANTGTSAPAA
jgi:hypothetical protein